MTSLTPKSRRGGARPSALWTATRDAELMDLVSEDLPFEMIAQRMGLTRGQVIGRFNRLRQALGE